MAGDRSGSRSADAGRIQARKSKEGDIIGWIGSTIGWMDTISGGGKKMVDRERY